MCEERNVSCGDSEGAVGRSVLPNSAAFNAMSRSGFRLASRLELESKSGVKLVDCCSTTLPRGSFRTTSRTSSSENFLLSLKGAVAKGSTFSAGNSLLAVVCPLLLTLSIRLPCTGGESEVVVANIVPTPGPEGTPNRASSDRLGPRLSCVPGCDDGMPLDSRASERMSSISSIPRWRRRGT